MTWQRNWSETDAPAIGNTYGRILTEAVVEIQELESKMDQVRTLLVAIDEALCCNPRIERVVALLSDASRNPFAGLMTCAQRDLAVNVTHAEQPEQEDV